MALKTVLVISISTLRMIFPGLPGVDDTAPPVSKTVAIGLWSDVRPGLNAKAQIAAPWELQAGNPLKLTLAPADQDSAVPKAQSGVAIKTYWGTRDTVAEGQPRTTAAVAQASGYPTASYAYWPIDGDKPLKETATPVGEYRLLSNYADSATATVTPDQGFLAPVELSGVTGKPDLSKPLKIEWNVVPKALGYVAICFGGTDKESITWTSSNDPDKALGLEDRALTPEQVKDYIDKGILLPAGTTSCTIPAGIFGGAKGAMLTVLAIGPDAVVEKDGVRTEVIVRSIATAPISDWFAAPAPAPAK